MENQDYPYTVLICEDNEDLTFLIKRRLSSLGLTTKCAHTGGETLDYCLRQNGERLLLLLDYKLSDMTASQLVKTLQEKKLFVPFLVMTGYGSEKVAVEMLKLGAQDYLVKNEQFLDLLGPIVLRSLETVIKEENLHQTRKALNVAHQAIMASTNGVAIGEVKNDYPVLYYNPAFEKITSYSCETNGSLKELFATYDSQANPQLNRVFDQLTEQGRCRLELRKNINNHVTWQKADLSIMEISPHSPKQILCIMTDFTEQKQAEQQLHGLREQLERAQRFAITGQLSLELAHEIGNPITLMSSKIQSLIANNNSSPEDLLTLLGHIDRIKDLLMRFSESGQNQPLCISEESIGQIIQHVLDLVPSYDETNRLTVSMEIAPDLPTIRLDKAQITQVLLNLLKNATEACTDKGVIRFVAEQRYIEPQNSTFIVVKVIDNGCGMKKEQLGKIFESFYSTKSKDKSRGLGLPICQSIMLKHNGWLEADSTPGKGSVFSLFLPSG